MPKVAAPRTPSFEALVMQLRSPSRPLVGRRSGPLPLPDNIVCFVRRAASALNRPRSGRALHHRFVLIFALQTAATVCVDDRTIRIGPGEGLLVFPFQFHHYMQPEAEDLCWLFVTFESSEVDALQTLRFRPFPIEPVIRQVATELVTAYLDPNEADLTRLLLTLLLARITRLKPMQRRSDTPVVAPGLFIQVNQLAQRPGDPMGVKEMAHSLGISASHLRARFRASAGVSLGRHLRRLRLEKACGLLRLTPNRISEIADQCGFNSIYSFSRAFRVAFGLSPLAYRRSGDARPNPLKNAS